MKRFARIAAVLFGILTLQGCAAPGNDSSSANESTAGNTGTSFTPEKAFSEVYCPAEEALKWAKERPVVICNDSASGKETWDAFFSTVSEKKPASVLCAHYYELDETSVSPELYEAEKDQYPVMFFCLVEYDGKEYRVRIRDSRETTLDTDETYAYLLHLSGDNPDGARFKYTDEYDLVDDASVTLEDLQRSLYSSQSGDYIKHVTVYLDMHD